MMGRVEGGALRVPTVCAGLRAAAIAHPPLRRRQVHDTTLCRAQCTGTTEPTPRERGMGITMAAPEGPIGTFDPAVFQMVRTCARRERPSPSASHGSQPTPF